MLFKVIWLVKNEKHGIDRPVQIHFLRLASNSQMAKQFDFAPTIDASR